jgi:DNA-binding XRE family transcriptional regulator
MTSKLRIKPGLLKRLREVRDLPSEDAQARLIGVDRTTLRRIDAGAAPSAAFMASLCDVFGLGLGEAFEVVTHDPLHHRQPAPVRETVAA